MPPSLACGQQWIETVLTCEGDYYDPDLPRKLTVFNNRLQQILRAEKKRLVIKKVEPWNSVKVTLNIPPEAAFRLRTLAENGSQALRSLGILAVQVEGDRVISLTLAGNGTGLQRAPTAGVSTCNPSCTSDSGNGVSGLSHSIDRPTSANDRLPANAAVLNRDSPPPAINGCLASVHPASLLGQHEPAKRPRKGTGSSRAGNKKQALDQVAGGPAVVAPSLLPAAGAELAPAKPRYRHKKVAADTSAVTDQGQQDTAAAAMPATTDARSAQGTRASTSCLVTHVGNGQLSASLRAGPPMQTSPGLIVPSSCSSSPPAAGESIKAINDIITSLQSASARRGGLYAASESPVPVAATAPAVPSRRRLTDGRAAVVTAAAGAAAAAVPPAGGTQSHRLVQARQRRALAGGCSSSSGRLGGDSTLTGPLIIAKHLYHPAGEDRHAQEVYRMHAVTSGTDHRDSGVTVGGNSCLLNLGKEPSNCSLDVCRNSEAARVGTDGFLSYEQQQRSYASCSSPRRLQPSSGYSSHDACMPGTPSVMEHGSSLGQAHTADRGCQDSMGAAHVVRIAGMSLMRGRASATSSSCARDQSMDMPSPADRLHPDVSSSRGYRMRGQRSVAIEALRHCESPTVVDHLEGTIMSVTGDEGDDGAATSRATFEERDGVCVVNIGVAQAFPAMQDAIYSMPPCLDIAKVAADLQSSQDSPMNSPTALAALSKHESASSETEMESASAVSVDSGIASSSPKSDLGEAGASSAAHTPGGSEHEVQLLGAVMLRSDAVGDSSAGSMSACGGHDATAGTGLWMASDDGLACSPAAALSGAAVHVGAGGGNGGGSTVVMLHSQDVPPYKGLASGGLQSDSRRGAARVTHGAGGSSRDHEEPFGAHRMHYGGGTYQELQALPTTCRERKRPVNHT